MKHSIASNIRATISTYQGRIYKLDMAGETGTATKELPQPQLDSCASAYGDKHILV